MMLHRFRKGMMIAEIVNEFHCYMKTELDPNGFFFPRRVENYIRNAYLRECERNKQRRKR